jgi:hypothetical protein
MSVAELKRLAREGYMKGSEPTDAPQEFYHYRHELLAVVRAAQAVEKQWRNSLGWDRDDTFKALFAALGKLDKAG